MREIGIGRRLKACCAAALVSFGSTIACADGPTQLIGVTDVQGNTDWTGFYVGGKLGGVWSDISWTQDLNVFSAGGIAPPGASADFAPSGFAGGIIGGANLQNGHWVFGLELSFSGTDLSQTIKSPFFPVTDTFSSQIDWLATVEGRIGVSFDNYLVFAKGGWVGSNATLTLLNTPSGATATTDSFVDGWTIGGGLELLCWSNVVLGLEYDYVNLNLSDAGSCPLCPIGIVGGSAPAAITGDATISSVMARASYLFRPED